MLIINVRREVLVAPHTHGSTGLVTVWGAGGRCMDLPRHYQDRALDDLKALDPWPAALIRAYRQVNRLGGVDDVHDDAEEDWSC